MHTHYICSITTLSPFAVIFSVIWLMKSPGSSRAEQCFPTSSNNSDSCLHVPGHMTPTHPAGVTSEPRTARRRALIRSAAKAGNRPIACGAICSPRSGLGAALSSKTQTTNTKLPEQHEHGLLQLWGRLHGALGVRSLHACDALHPSIIILPILSPFRVSMQPKHAFSLVCLTIINCWMEP